jgi:tetratricopeptide (TPR) repeat protein
MESALGLLQQSLALLEGPELAGVDTRRESAFVLQHMGRMAYNADLEEAARLAERSLALYRALGDRWGMAGVLNDWGNAVRRLGAYDKARPLFEESLALYRALGNPFRIAVSLGFLAWVAALQGQIDKAERLIQEGLAMRPRIDSQFAIGRISGENGMGLFWIGKLAEAHTLLEKSVAIKSDLGIRNHESVRSNTWLGEVEAHIGQYERARTQGQTSLALARELDYRQGIGMALCLLSEIALTEGAYAEAEQLSRESATVLEEIGQRVWLSIALACSGYAARGLGQRSLAWHHLHRALRMAGATQALNVLMYVLPGLALLLADEGQTERAVELYALASRHPLVANSRWFEDVAGRHIAAAAAALPPDVVTAAQERGRTRDLDATVADLLAEWEEE